MKQPPARCRKTPPERQAVWCGTMSRESSSNHETLRRLRRHSSIYIDIRKPSNGWGAHPGAAEVKISRGIIFEDACWTLTKSPCEWRVDSVAAGFRPSHF